MQKQKIKDILNTIRNRYRTIYDERKNYYEMRNNKSMALDEKIRLAIIEDIFNEIEMELEKI